MHKYGISSQVRDHMCPGMLSLHEQLAVYMCMYNLYKLYRGRSWHKTLVRNDFCIKFSSSLMKCKRWEARPFFCALFKQISILNLCRKKARKIFISIRGTHTDHVLSNTTSQCCYKPLYLQVILLLSRWLYGPFGDVDHSIVHTNRNVGIHKSWLPPWSIQLRPCSGCMSQGVKEPMVYVWPLGNPCSLCHICLDLLIYFLCYSMSFEGFPSS